VRTAEAWLHSAVRHFSASFNPNRATWHLDPFTDQVHRIAYGRTEFDADIFLSRYRRHNVDVLAHFKDRPGDLLIMSKQEWPALCQFLGHPVPSAPYPHLNGFYSSNGGFAMSEEHPQETPPENPPPIPPQPEPAEEEEKQPVPNQPVPSAVSTGRPSDGVSSRL